MQRLPSNRICLGVFFFVLNVYIGFQLLAVAREKARRQDGIVYESLALVGRVLVLVAALGLAESRHLFAMFLSLWGVPALGSC